MPKWFAYMCDDEGMGTGCMDQIWTVVMVAPVTRVHHIRPHKYQNASKRPWKWNYKEYVKEPTEKHENGCRE